ncbi:MAG: VOC family protein [Ktedonobacteraceae bacterium]|nr:VOC family protein [Ktedonobacteraceae bacterium]
MTSLYERKGMNLPRLQHASLPVAPGGQAKVREFYGGVLGLQEKPAPPVLAARGILWFAAGDNEMELHFIPDTEHPANPKEGRHICLEVPDVEQWRVTIRDAGYEIIEDAPLLHRPRFFCHDPFGNRLEFTTIEGNYLG